MFENIENLQLVSASSGTNKQTHSKVDSRKTYAFILRTKGNSFYKFPNKTLETTENKMIFIPKGSSYEHFAISDVVCYSAISFHCDMENPEPALYSLENFPEEIQHIFTHITSNWKLANAPEKYKCLSLFYSLLSYVATFENAEYLDKHHFKIIDPALVYLKEHLFDISLKTDKLHRICGISDTYFRKIFFNKFGVTPQKYIVSKRISQAKSIIESGDFASFKEVAQSVGFSDPLYFSRVFKQKYGISPSNINKEINNS